MREVKDFLLSGFAIAFGLGFTFVSGICISWLFLCWILSSSFSLTGIGAFLWWVLRLFFLLLGRDWIRSCCFWLLRDWICYVFFSVHVYQ